jgi:hypothetical protein
MTLRHKYLKIEPPPDGGGLVDGEVRRPGGHPSLIGGGGRYESSAPEMLDDCIRQATAILAKPVQMIIGTFVSLQWVWHRWVVVFIDQNQDWYTRLDAIHDLGTDSGGIMVTYRDHKITTIEIWVEQVSRMTMNYLDSISLDLFNGL